MTKRLLPLIIMFLAIVNIQAQKSSVSPYSFFGIGDENITKTVEEISMGETGVTNQSDHQLFLSNPASLASLRFTTYGLGVANRTITVSDGINSGRSSATALSYLFLGVPIGDKAGLAFGLQPNSNVGYALSQEFKDASDVVTEANLFFGSGGTNRVFLGYGRKIHKFVTVGAEGSFIFGRISNNILNRRDGIQFATQSEINSNVSGFKLSTGIQYHAPINKEKKLNLDLGIVVGISSNLKTRGDELLYSLINNSSGVIIAKDTILNRNFKGTIKNPLNSTFGIGIGKAYNWKVSLEYAYQGAFSFNGSPLDGNTIVNYKSANRISLGGYYLPKFNSITSYWDKVIYRGGLKYKQSGLVVNNTDINEFGISFGVGLPVSKELSTFNLGFELGKRGTVKNSLVKENYFNFRIGLTLNDKWFQKRKIQ
ncbi:MAG: hypothetical protein L3J45_08405 [Flavobacteriaceae bacterium]|nr:hypothetical protein [Flavobacteriaceae bacterium]